MSDEKKTPANPKAHYELNQNDAIAQFFEDQVVLINLTTSIYFSLNDASVGIWQNLYQGTSLEEIGKKCAPLVKALGISEDQLHQDLLNFANQLLDQGLLVVRSSESAPIDFIPPAFGTKYIAPLLEIHDDIKHLLALDPPAPGLQDKIEALNTDEN